MKDTIAAIATPIGIGAIGIIRISGEDAARITDKVFKCPSFLSISQAIPRYMYKGEIVGEGINESCMLAYFASPKSYTGENLIELYCHGGARLLEGILSLILHSGARLAENGEFTKRAYLNGKLKLSDAEGIIDMITADSEAAISAGYRLMSGRLSKEINRLNNMLLEAVSGLEASLDYPEEMEEDMRIAAKNIINNTLEQLNKLYATRDCGRLIKYGINVAIIGAPNAGKSSLLNALLKSDRAIVSEIAGTTRDTICESIEVEGVKINFIDTAGIRQSTDSIERMGVERTFKAIQGADIIIKLIDATTDEIIDSDKTKTTITVYNKTDLVEKTGKEMKISAKTGRGLDLLLEEIVKIANIKSSSAEVLTNLRHIDAIKRAIDYLKEALNNYDYNTTDCLLVDIKAAYSALGEIDGSTANERIVDEIFRRFCVGK